MRGEVDEFSRTAQERLISVQTFYFEGLCFCERSLLRIQIRNDGLQTSGWREIQQNYETDQSDVTIISGRSLLATHIHL